MEEDSHILSLVQSVIDQHGGAENLLGKRAKPAASKAAEPEDVEEIESEAAS